MSKRGISEKSYMVANVFPSVTDEEVLLRAKLENIQASEGGSVPFQITWTYSFGWDKEFVILRPGDEHIMRESDARACYQEKAEEGLAMWAADATEKEKDQARISALRRGLTFYRERGQKKVTDWQKRHNADPEGERYGLLWVNHYNQALADTINDVLKAENAAKAETLKIKRGQAAA